MNKLVSSARQKSQPRRHIAVATVLSVAASLLVAAGISNAAQADPEPAEPTAPSVTTFPRPQDPDAPLRAAIEEAKRQNTAVAVEEAFTETSRVWAYPDGHLTTQSYGSPAQLKQADGSWAWMDTTLIEQDGVLKPKLAKANVQFSLGGDQPFVSLERDKGQRFALSWPTDLPRPEIKGNIARYVDAAGKGADLVVTALPTGFQHDVVLRERPSGSLEFRFPVETAGVKLGLTKSGGLSLVSSKGKTVMSAPMPRMWDSVDPSAGQPRRETKVKTAVETSGGQTMLVLKPDAKWLNDPDTTYPVTVDPTTTLGITQETTVKSPNAAMAPGYVARSSDRTCPTPTTCTYNEWASRALMAFDTTPINGRQVFKATMQLSLNGNASTCSSLQAITAHRITQSWTAASTSWATRPTTTAEERSSVDPCAQVRTDGAVWSWDLTAMTRVWASGTPNYGLTLQLGTEFPVPQGFGEYFSFWNLLWGGPRVPKLSVDWVLPPEIPTVTAESIDSISGNDAIARTTNVKVTYKSSVPETTPLDYTVTVNDSTMPPPATQLPTGEAAVWKLDEASGSNVTDSSGNGLNGTLTGTHSRVAGQVGQAVKLSPGGLISAGKPVINTDQSYTVATWVRLNSGSSSQAVLSQMGVNQPAFNLSYTASSAAELDQRWTLSVITEDRADSLKMFAMQSEKPAKVGQWTHLAVQHDQTAHKFRLYVDGEPVAERDYTIDWNARGAFEVGRGRDFAEPATLDGAVDELRVYQRALTGQEIRTLVGAPNTSTHTNVPSGQVIDKTFPMDNPASFKFVVKACRTGVTPPSCNESPAYRITSDAPLLPTDTETGMADPAQPILSGMVNRPSGGPVTAKYYLYDNNGTPVGSAPLGTRTVNGGERASFQLPTNTVQSGTTYKWQMVACAVGQGGASTPTDPPPTPTPTPTPSPLPQGLVAAYGMDEGSGSTIADASAKAGPGTTTATSWVAGKHGKALSFDGSTSLATIPHSDVLKLTTGMTLSAWVNPTTVSSWRTVAMKGHTAGSAYGLYASNGTSPAAWLLNADASSHQMVNGTTALPTATWSHLAFTYNGNVAKLYINGTQAGELAMTGSLVDDGGALRIGNNAKWGEYFSGAIDEVRVYNRAQTVAEIQTDMQTPITAPSPTSSPTPTPTPTQTTPPTNTGVIEEVCTSKTAPVSFTTPGTPPPPPAEDIRHLTLGKDNFVIKTAKTDPTACNGNPCTVTDDTVMRIGGTGVDKTAAVIGFKLDEVPDGAAISEGILKLGTATCAAGACPPGAIITATPLKNPVTSESRGSDLPADADTAAKPSSLPLSGPQADIAGGAYQWLLLTSNNDTVITFGEAAAAEQPSLALTYIPGGPPSKVLNLSAQAGDAGAVASWGVPESNGSVAMLDGYDVELSNSAGTVVKTLDVKEPYATITGLTNGESHTVKVRAKTAFGQSDWEATTVTPKAVPPPPVKDPNQPCIPFLDGQQPQAKAAAAESGAQAYIDRVKAYYQAQDAVLEGRAASIWDVPGVGPQDPSTAKLSLLNAALVQYDAGMERVKVTRSDSSVALDDIVVQPGSGGSVHVVAKVTRAWTETSPDPGSGQSRASTRGVVHPSESTISIHVFDRCGNMSEIQVPMPKYQDPTDGYDRCAGFVEPGGGEHQVCEDSGSGNGNAGGAGPSGLEGWDARRTCPSVGCKSSLSGWNYLTKGLSFRVGSYFRWEYESPDLPNLPLFVNDWGVSTEVKPLGSFGKSKIDKLILDNIQLKVETSLTFRSPVFAPSISWPPGLDITTSDESGTLSGEAPTGVRVLVPESVKPFSITCGTIWCKSFSGVRHSAKGTLTVLARCKSGATKPSQCMAQPKTISINGLGGKFWWAPTTWPFNYDDRAKG